MSIAWTLNAYYAAVKSALKEKSLSIKISNKSLSSTQKKKAFPQCPNTDTFACGWIQNVQVSRDIRFTCNLCSTSSLSQSRFSLKDLLKRRRKSVLKWTSIWSHSSAKRQNSSKRSKLFSSSAKDWETVFKRVNRRVNRYCLNRVRIRWGSFCTRFWRKKWRARSRK